MFMMLVVVAVEEAMANALVVIGDSSDFPDARVNPDSTIAQEAKAKRTVREVVREFDRTEDDYIEPPHFEMAVELRATRTFEDFILCSNGQSIMFSPDQRIKVGPYFGWRWIFLGTTFDLKDISLFSHDGKRDGKQQDGITRQRSGKPFEGTPEYQIFEENRPDKPVMGEQGSSLGKNQSDPVQEADPSVPAKQQMQERYENGRKNNLKQPLLQEGL